MPPPGHSNRKLKAKSFTLATLGTKIKIENAKEYFLLSHSELCKRKNDLIEEYKLKLIEEKEGKKNRMFLDSGNWLAKIIRINWILAHLDIPIFQWDDINFIIGYLSSLKPHKKPLEEIIDEIFEVKNIFQNQIERLKIIFPYANFYTSPNHKLHQTNSFKNLLTIKITSYQAK